MPPGTIGHKGASPSCARWTASKAIWCGDDDEFIVIGVRRNQKRTAANDASF